MAIRTVFLGIILALAISASQIEANNSQDQAKIDESLRLAKGENNQIDHGPVYKQKEFHTQNAKKQKIILGHRGEQHWTNRKTKTSFGHQGEQHWGSGAVLRKPTKLSHDLDDIRLQDIAYEPATKDVDVEEKTPETPKTKVVDIEKKKKKEGVEEINKPSKKFHKRNNVKKDSRRAIKKAMKKALKSGMKPGKVYKKFAKAGGDTKFPKKFYKKFLKKQHRMKKQNNIYIKNKGHNNNNKNNTP